MNYIDVHSCLTPEHYPIFNPVLALIIFAIMPALVLLQLMAKPLGNWLHYKSSHVTGSDIRSWMERMKSEGSNAISLDDNTL